MKKTLYVTILCVCTGMIWCAPATAQSPMEKYQAESIYLQPFAYVKNGQRYPLGLFNKSLKKEMEISPNAMLEYKRYVKNRNFAYAAYFFGIGAYAAGLLVDSENQPLKDLLKTGGLGMIAGSFYFAIGTSKHLNKAIWLRNGEILK
jgi:hypothetical protein